MHVKFLLKVQNFGVKKQYLNFHLLIHLTCVYKYHSAPFLSKEITHVFSENERNLYSMYISLETTTFGRLSINKIHPQWEKYCCFEGIKPFSQYPVSAKELKCPCELALCI